MTKRTTINFPRLNSRKVAQRSGSVSPYGRDCWSDFFEDIGGTELQAEWEEYCASAYRTRYDTERTKR